MRGRPKDGKNIQMLEPRKDDLSNTLTTAIKDNLLADGISIRKLTPLEYFRLQGFSDEDYKLLRQHKFSDSQLYKLIGNSIAVPVLEYIFKELCKDYELLD
jgi:DNA (cytosine-5)-methyltransferase 1